jgi:hypothetical protein
MKLLWAKIIDLKSEKELASEEALGPLNRFWLPVSENPDHHPKKKTIQPEDAFEDTAFNPWFEIVKL